MPIPPTIKKIGESGLVFAKDKTTNQVTAIATTADMQIGLSNSPASLSINGSFSVKTLDIALAAGTAYDIPSAVTNVNVTTSGASGTVTLRLPSNPKKGQLIYIKDAAGNATVVSITVIGSPLGTKKNNNITAHLIDKNNSSLITASYGTLQLLWSDTEWYTVSTAALAAGGGGGSGDVVGPASATDNTIARFDSTTGKLIQGSGVVIDDSNNITTAGDIAVNGGDLTSSATTFNLLNSTVTTLNVGGAATTLEIGAATGTTSINNALTVDGSTTLGDSSVDTVTINGTTTFAGSSVTTTFNGDIAVNGGDFTSSAATFNLLNSGVTTLNIGGGASTATNIGHASGLTTIAGDLKVAGNNIRSSGGSAAINLSGTNVTVYGDLEVAGDDILSFGGVSAIKLNGSGNVAISGDLTVTGNDIKASGGTTAISLSGADVTIAGDLAVNGGDLTTTAATMNLVNAATTVNLGSTAIARTTNIATGAANQTVTLGSTTGASATTINAGTGVVTIASTTTSNADALIGAAEIGTHPYAGSNYAMFGHKDLNHAVDGNYALVQSNVGDTFLGAVADKIIYLKNGTKFLGSFYYDSSFFNKTFIYLDGAVGSPTVVTIGSTHTTSNTTINAGSGSIDIGTTPQSRSINIGTGTSVQTIGIGTGAAANAITIGSNAASIVSINGGDALNLYTDNGSLTIDSGTGNTSIGTFGYARTTDIATGAANQTVTLGSTHGGSATTINAGSGSITITSTTTSNADALIGAAEIGTHPYAGSNYAMFGHKDLNHAADGNYALVQSNVGDTFLGAVADKIIYLKNGTKFLGSFYYDSSFFNKTFLSLDGAVGSPTVVTIGSTHTTSNTTINAGSGSIDIGITPQSRSINIGTGTSIQTIGIGTGAAANAITIGSNAASIVSINGGDALNLYTDNGSLTIDSGTGNTNIGTFGYARTTNIATGAANQTVTLGSTHGGSATTINAGSGSIIITSTTTSNADALIGAAEIGTHPYAGSNYAMFGHKDLNHAVDGNYALVQSNVGDTFLGAAADKIIYLKNGTKFLGSFYYDSSFFNKTFLSLDGAVGSPAVVTIGSTHTTSNTTINAGSGSIDIGTTPQSRSINIGTGTSIQTIGIGTGAAANAITIGSNVASIVSINGGDTLNLYTDNGSLTIDSGTGNTNIGTFGYARTTNIATGAANQTVVLGSTHGGSATTINAGSGSITITSTTTSSADALIGAAEIGTHPYAGSNYAMFGHKDLNHAVDGNYALVQSNVGDTFLGAVADKIIYFKNGTKSLGYFYYSSFFAKTIFSLDGAVGSPTAVTIGSTHTTSNTTINAGSGSIDIGITPQSRSINIGTGTSVQTIGIGTGAAANAITIGSNAASIVSINGGDALNLYTDNGSLTIDSGTGNTSIGTFGYARTTDIATGAANQTVALGSTHGGSSLTLNAGSGSLGIGTSNAVRSISIGTGTSVQTIGIGTGAAANLISIGSNAASTVSINGGDALNLYADGGTITIDAGGAGANAINIGTFGYAQTISVGNTTGATSLAFRAGSGGITFETNATASGDLAVNGGDLTTTAATMNLVNAATTINLGSTAVTRAINIGTNGTNVQTIDIGTGNAANAITLGSNAASIVSINGGDALNLYTDNGSLTIDSGTGNTSIGTFGYARTTSIATGAANQTVTLGSTHGGSALTLNAGSGSIDIGTFAAIRTTNIATGAAAQTVTLGSTTGASTTTINAGTGYINASTRVGVNLSRVPSSMLDIKQSSDPTFSSTTITNNGSAIRIEDDDGDAWIIGAGDNNNLWFGWTTTASSTTSTAQGFLNSAANAFTLMNFTGQHRCIPESRNIDDYSNKIGLIVIAIGQYQNPLSGSTIGAYNRNIAINDATPIIELASQRNDKRSFGVVSELEDVSDGAREFAVGKFVSVTESGGAEDNRLFINAIGEGAIWVCNINGNLENGDYITTCEIPGYGMKQEDDIMRNYTVAKITCDCSFDLNSSMYECEEFYNNGIKLIRAFVGCTYHCG